MYLSMFAFSYCSFNLSTNHLQPALLQAHLTPFSVSTFFFLLSVFNTAIELCNIINQIQSLLCSKPSNMSPFYSIANEELVNMATDNSLTLALLIFPSCHLIYSSHVNHTFLGHNKDTLILGFFHSVLWTPLSHFLKACAQMSSCLRDLS